MAKTFIFDLDGTLYLGHTPIPGAADKLEELRSLGYTVLFLTNAATRTREGVVEKLVRMGIEARKDEVYPGSYLLAQYISRNAPKAKVFVIGEHGLKEELTMAGHLCVENSADIVAVGLDRKFDYEKLAIALTQIHSGAKLIASNRDHIYPTEHGPMPGCGSIVAAVETASEKKAFSVGKPNTFAFELMVREHRFKKEDAIVVGDRVDTDIMFAKACGARSILVETGYGQAVQIKGSDMKADLILPSVTMLPSDL